MISLIDIVINSNLIKLFTVKVTQNCIFFNRTGNVSFEVFTVGTPLTYKWRCFTEFSKTEQLKIAQTFTFSGKCSQ